MRLSQIERLQRSREFEISYGRLRMQQIETMISDFERQCADLEQQIKAEEVRVRVADPSHFAYPMYARAARERRAKIQASTEILKSELSKLRFERDEAVNQSTAA
jgi:hypothetical protein